MNRPLRFGIEEEYFITDLDTRRMCEQPSGASIEADRAFRFYDCCAAERRLRQLLQDCGGA
ncbi:hypothetical protein C1Y11_06915 [Pseudomonas sp. FW305-20]|nr:hypothetical protein C1Y11_06915 [Pseudomonas sp. FW305-20]PMU18484.1 hypothetical protein C1Y10_12940 [Pseudomonas sp. FW305-122]PMU40248.1 hypothetical protein C1Y12_11515 [Pseudomonas sp. FW305-47B]PMX59812.1 hypothetical protein C1Y13_16770 [Pseudomonas sp. FW305-33]PMX68382.1 hypothetical protein C1X12_11605 [Pseudomonas sp. FW305-60]